MSPGKGWAKGVGFGLFFHKVDYFFFQNKGLKEGNRVVVPQAGLQNPNAGGSL